MSDTKKNKYQEFKETVNSYLHSDNPFANALGYVEKYTKVDRQYVALGGVVFLFLYIMIGWGAALVVNLVGFVYPAYASCKAIDSEDKDDDTQWLTYWVVFAFFGVLEFFTDILLSWMPFYFLLKCIFLIYCFLPMENNGSAIIYHRVIRPFLAKNEKVFSQASQFASEAVKDVGGSVMGAVKSAGSKVDAQSLLEAKAKVDEQVNQWTKKDD